MQACRSLFNMRQGFLPADDPATQFNHYPELEPLNKLGKDLPSLLLEKDFRSYIRAQDIPAWSVDSLQSHTLPELRLYYLRLGFIASAYINQIGQALATRLPKNIAVPLVKACQLLKRPPILSYDGYALYNWKRFDQDKSVTLGNIDTLQNFVHLYDEHWFILIHVEIEYLARKIVAGISEYADADKMTDGQLNQIVATITHIVKQQTAVLKRIPEKMSAQLYFKLFRPYIRFFENVTYEGVEQPTINFRGETGAQSSIVPALVAFLKIPHKGSELTCHLNDMRHYMPKPHQLWLRRIESLAPIKEQVDKEIFNRALEAVAGFRETHYGWAKEYIDKHVTDPRGTGGTPYMIWLKQLIDETRAYKKK